MAITTGILTAGANTHLTSSEEANGIATDFVVIGIVGSLTNTAGVSPATGGWAVNAQASPNATVAVGSGVAYVTGTPTSQGSQTFRIKNSASQNVTISANASGSTKYDWVYIKLDPTNLNTPNTAADNVATLVTSRSSSATSDDGTPPTYGLNIAVVTVANGFSTITNGNITDKRTQSGSTPAITGSESALVTERTEVLFDFIASGCVWTADAAGSTRNASMTAGVAYIAGKRLTVAAVNARSFTASKDVYVGLIDAGNGTATVVYFDNTTNAASPSLVTAGYTILVVIVVVGATNIAAATSINQGQPTALLPIASSIPYVTTDSLGNLINPRDPQREILSYTEQAAGQGSITTTVDITGMSLTVKIPTNVYKVQLVGEAIISSATAGTTATLFITDASNVVQVQRYQIIATANAAALQTINLTRNIPVTPGSTYTFKLRANGSATIIINNGSAAASPSILKVIRA